ncbi:MAG: hypothetical protein ACLT9Z_07275 [Finegoldia magna]
MILLAITDLDEKIDKQLPKSYTEYISDKKSNCSIFINHFMNDREDSDTYKKLADKVQHVIKLEEVVSKLNEEDFIKCDTFRYFDEVTIKNIVDVLISGADEFDKYEEIINKRKSLNWYPDYKNYYDALEQAINLFRLKDNIDYIKEKITL